MRFAKLRIATLLLVLISVRDLLAAPAFPGPQPGPARAGATADQLVLENDVLAVRYDLTKGLRLVEAKDKLTGNTWNTGASECLQLLMYRAPSPKPIVFNGSEMEVIGQPLLRDADVTRASGREADRYPGKEIVLRLRPHDGSFSVEWRATLRDESNYIRQSVTIQATNELLESDELTLIDLPAADAEVRGSVDGSPAVAGNWFMGFEHPMSKSQLIEDSRGKRVRCSYPFAPPLEPGTPQEYSAVLGLAPMGQLRRAFLYYLEHERAHPYRPFLHYAPGEDAGAIYQEMKGKKEQINKFRAEEDQYWQDIFQEFGRELTDKRQVFIDCFETNYIWDNPGAAPWQFDTAAYANGFRDSRLTAAKYGATLGVWYSPDAVTGSPGRVLTGIDQKFEGYAVGIKSDDQTRGLFLSGPRYFARVRISCINMMKRYGVSYYKFDGIAEGYRHEYKPSGAGPFASDVEAILKIFAELRHLDPNVFINWSTGSWPSPFALRWADDVWHQGADVGLYGDEYVGFGKGSPRQRWLTYRDSATYQNGVQRAPLYPITSYMLHGMEINLCSLGRERKRVRGLDPKDVVDEIRSYFATGTCLQEMYLTPSLMKPEWWDVLAEAAKWSRANSDVLVDTHWIGGDPARQQVYGFASWSPRTGILTLRNPDDQPQSISLDISQVFELPEHAPQRYTLKSPWRDQADKPAIQLTAGQPHEFELQPFDVLVWEATPSEKELR